MKKKKKGKPREQVFLGGNTIQEKMFNYYIKEMEEKTENFNTKNNLDTNFCVFQSIPDKNKVIDTIFNLSYFYNNNFVGNKDFMHIPTISQITQNFTRYPIMLVSKKDKDGADEILGATTIKIENNSSISSNPYFPSKNEYVLSITGILSNSNAFDENGNKIRGIGKELYKSAIKGAYKLNEEENIRLVCEIDCRNVNSIKSILKAVKELQNEKYKVKLCVTGYYEIYNSDKKLVEAPTLILEVDLEGEKNFNNVQTQFSYLQCNFAELYSDLANVIKANTKERKRYLNIIKENLVVYHSIKPINVENLKIDVGNTADGNDRVPIANPLEIDYVVDNIN